MKQIFLLLCALIAAVGIGAVIELLVQPQANHSTPVPTLAATADRVTAVQLAFDAARRPGDIRQVLKDAGYSLDERELKVAEKLVYDYGWYPVIGAFRQYETFLLQSRNRGSDDKGIKALFDAALEMCTNNMEPIVQGFVLEKYGLFKFQ